MLDPDLEIAISCKNCGHKVPFIVKEFKNNPHYLCPECKIFIKLNKEEVNAYLDDIEFIMSSVFGLP